jgi:choline dehydrogenase
LLEAGPSDSVLGITLPVAFLKLYKTDIDWDFVTDPQPNALDRSLYWPRGKVIGGSSSINAMIYQRGHKHDYDNWDKLLGGKSGWTYQDVLHYFKKSERQLDRQNVDVDYHGFDGEWTIRTNPAQHQIIDEIIETIHEEMKVPLNHDFSKRIFCNELTNFW